MNLKRSKINKTKPLAPTTREAMIHSILGGFAREILIEPGRCNGCKDCLDACKKAIAFSYRCKEPIPRISIIQHEGYYMPHLCRNCEEPPCVYACMTGCRMKDQTGWVSTDYSRCVGCWMCILVCPFGAIKIDKEKGVAIKCDGCTFMQIAPCVEVCKPGALKQMGINEFVNIRRREDSKRLVWVSAILTDIRPVFHR